MDAPETYPPITDAPDTAPLKEPLVAFIYPVIDAFPLIFS